MGYIWIEFTVKKCCIFYYFLVNYVIRILYISKMYNRYIDTLSQQLLNIYQHTDYGCNLIYYLKAYPACNVEPGVQKLRQEAGRAARRQAHWSRVRHRFVLGWWRQRWEDTVGQGKHFGGQGKANQSFSSSMEEMDFQKLPLLKEDCLAKTENAQWLEEVSA